MEHWTKFLFSILERSVKTLLILLVTVGIGWAFDLFPAALNQYVPLFAVLVSITLLANGIDSLWQHRKAKQMPSRVRSELEMKIRRLDSECKKVIQDFISQQTLSPQIKNPEDQPRMVIILNRLKEIAVLKSVRYEGVISADDDEYFYCELTDEAFELFRTMPDVATN